MRRYSSTWAAVVAAAGCAAAAAAATCAIVTTPGASDPGGGLPVSSWMFTIARDSEGEGERRWWSGRFRVPPRANPRSEGCGYVGGCEARRMLVRVPRPSPYLSSVRGTGGPQPWRMLVPPIRVQFRLDHLDRVRSTS